MYIEYIMLNTHHFAVIFDFGIKYDGVFLFALNFTKKKFNICFLKLHIMISETCRRIIYIFAVVFQIYQQIQIYIY